jgi:TonB family protein
MAEQYTIHMKRSYLFALLTFVLWAQTLPAFASDLEKTVKKQYAKQMLAVRSEVQGTHLEFDSSGKPLKSSKDNWTVYGAIYVERITIEPDKLLIEGPLAAHGTTQKKGKPELITLGNPIKVEIQLDHPASSVDDVHAVLDRVFFLDEKVGQHSVPEFRRADFVVTDGSIHKVGPKGGVIAPKPTYTPEPEFSEEARSKGLRHGTVVLEVVVDKSGTISRIRIVRAFGMGLDQQSVETVKKWLFQPAQLNGEPVEVLMNVEVSFDRN